VREIIKFGKRKLIFIYNIHESILARPPQNEFLHFDEWTND